MSKFCLNRSHPGKTAYECTKELGHTGDHANLAFDNSWPNEEESNNDVVNHPQHYKSEKGLESIDVIEGFNLNFHLGNVVKYILRAGKKDKTKTVEDLKKARWYLDRYIIRYEDSK